MFAAFWPTHEELWPGVNEAMKYVLSSTVEESGWKNSVFLTSVEAIKQLKQSEGPDLKVQGSGQLVQTLFKHDLVDELWLLIHPLTLGTGTKLFGEGTIPARFQLVESKATPSGVIAAHYQRVGEVKTGRMAG